MKTPLFLYPLFNKDGSRVDPKPLAKQVMADLKVYREKQKNSSPSKPGEPTAT